MRCGAGIAVETSRPCRFPRTTVLLPNPLAPPPFQTCPFHSVKARSTADANAHHPLYESSPSDAPTSMEDLLSELERLEGFRRKRALQKKRMQSAKKTYQFIAWAASLFLFGLGAFATAFRFFITKPKGSPFPWIEFAGTLALVAGGTMGMEMYARWAHRVWWHELPSGWALHKSHHEPRTGPFEANDIYAVANALPAFLLCYIGVTRPGIVGALLFGFGLGITLFGMAYMFVHDGLVHKRFPVGPLANVPFMKRVAAAHMIHHADKYEGKPFGMFLGPQELRHIPGAVEEMERLASVL